jgi:hypothetical protein
VPPRSATQAAQAKKSGESAEIARVRDRVWCKAAVLRRVGEIRRPLGKRVVEGRGTLGEKRQCSAPRIIAIDLKLGSDDPSTPARSSIRKLIEAAPKTLPGDAVGEVHSKKVERLRRKIGTKTSAPI